MSNSPSTTVQTTEQPTVELVEEYGWQCTNARKSVVHQSVRVWDDRELAERAMRNHSRQHKHCRINKQRVVTSIVEA